MPPRGRTTVRTPRRRKVWASERSTDAGQLVAFNANPQVLIDLLVNLKTDLGLSRPPSGVTVMRIIGTLQPGNSSACTINEINALSWGIAWVSNIIANAPAGTGQIPNSVEVGLREAQWLQRGTIFYRTNNGTNLPASATGRMLDSGTLQLDITQMRKQPTADAELVLIVTHQGNTGSAPALWFELNTMLALP